MMLRPFVLSIALLALSPLAPAAQSSREPSRDDVLATMKRATTFMTDTVAYKGGYVWNYLPDRSRRWGEMEARETMIWSPPTKSFGDRSPCRSGGVSEFVAKITILVECRF